MTELDIPKGNWYYHFETGMTGIFSKFEIYLDIGITIQKLALPYRNWQYHVETHTGWWGSTGKRRDGTECGRAFVQRGVAVRARARADAVARNSITEEIQKVITITLQDLSCGLKIGTEAEKCFLSVFY